MMHAIVTRMRNTAPQVTASDVRILDRKSLVLGVLERQRHAFRSCCNCVRSKRQW